MLRYLICADCYDVELDLKLDLSCDQDFLSQAHIRQINNRKNCINTFKTPTE